MIRRLCARDSILSLQEEQRIGPQRDQFAKIMSGETCPVPGGLGATATGAKPDTTILKSEGLALAHCDRSGRKKSNIYFGKNLESAPRILAPYDCQT